MAFNKDSVWPFNSLSMSHVSSAECHGRCLEKLFPLHLTSKAKSKLMNGQDMAENRETLVGGGSISC